MTTQPINKGLTYVAATVCAALFIYAPFYIFQPQLKVQVEVQQLR